MTVIEDIHSSIGGFCCDLCCLRFSGDPITKCMLEVRNQGQEPLAKKQRTNDCVCCFGLLSHVSVQNVIEKSVSCLNAAGYDDLVFTTTLSMPVCAGIREHSVHLYLRRTVAGYSDKVPLEKVTPLKELWKLMVNDSIGHGVSKKADNGYFSDLQINVEMTYRGDRRETDLICKLNGKCRPPVTRVMVESCLRGCSDAILLQNLQVPPDPPVAPPIYSIACSRDAIFLAGRYNKYSRQLSQTPWLVSGVRRTDSSVLEMLTERMLQTVRAGGVRFSASGREDVDVRTLGQGRPFVVELTDPHVTRLTTDDLRSLQRHINSQHPHIRLRHLQKITRESTCRLKEGEEEKTKSYSALVRCVAGVATPASLRRLEDLKELVLQQQTPVRVLHRRPMATRQRTVHWMRAHSVSDTVFKLELGTQAGTYIKEFVHGDLGRTTPSLGSLLDCRCDILALDVASVNLDWPPALPEDDEQQEQ